MALSNSRSRSDGLPVDPIVLTMHITRIAYSYHRYPTIPVLTTSFVLLPRAIECCTLSRAGHLVEKL
jgi:hypothetical protein